MPGPQHRITIQLDLSGYSFIIYDRNGTALSEGNRPCPVDLAVKELEPVLRKGQFSSVSVYYATWKYTLVPSVHYEKDHQRGYLTGVRDLLEDDVALSLDMPARKAVMVFAMPGAVYRGMSALSRNVRFYPLSHLLMDRLSMLEDNNRIVVSFSEGMLHIVAAERERLLFANSFPSADLATAEYFILSVTKEVMFNPEHTVLYVYGQIPGQIKMDISRYFAGVRNIQ